MIKAEWNYLVKHKFLLVVLCVVALIPSIYSVTFLKSMWDPYGLTSELPVAVVNQDQKTTYKGKSMHVGSSLTRNLKKSDSMNFKVVSSEHKAEHGLKNGKYFMVLTIPSNFSKNATTLLNNNPQKMVIHYHTSAGHNYIASKMTSTAAEKIKTSVGQQVTETYAKTIFKALEKMDSGLKTASIGNQQLATGTQKLQIGNDQIETNLETLANSSLTLAQGSNQVTNGLKTYIAGVQQVQTGNQQVATGLDDLLSKSLLLGTGVAALNSGINQLSSGAQAYVNGVQRVSLGTSQFNTSVQTVNQNIASLNNGTLQLSQGTQVVSNKLQQLTSSSKQLNSSVEQLATTNNIDPTEAQDQLDSLNSELDQLSTTNTQVQQVKSAVNKLQTAINNTTNQQTQLTTNVSQVADQQKLTETQKQAILAVTNSSDQSATRDALMSAMQSLTTTVNGLSTEATTTVDTSKISSTLTNLEMKQTSTQGALAKLASETQSFNTNLSAISTASHQLNSGTSIMVGEGRTLTDTLGQLATESAKLTDKTNEVAKSGKQLTTGLTSLSINLNQLANNMPTLIMGIQKLSIGDNSIYIGLSKLVSNGSTLISGTDKISSGNIQVASGASKLAAGSQELGSGLSQLKVGSLNLSTKLGQAAKKGHMNATNKTNQQVSAPVKTAHKELDRVDNNGTAMAPYMISVSLFVGALALNLLYDMYSPRKYPKTAVGWLLSKASVWIPFAFVESLIMFGLLCGIDGLSPVNNWATLGVIIVTALSTSALVTWLNLAFNKIGAFFSMALLVLQLGGSAGTYPIQLSNGFFKAIHPYLPMSYSVDALRKTLMIGSSSISDIGVLLGVLIVMIILMALFYNRRHGRLKEIDFNNPKEVMMTRNNKVSKN